MKLYTHIKEIIADTKTPVSLYLALRDKYASSVLLESSDYNSKEGHFSYICLKPIASFALNNGVVRIKSGKEITEKKIGYDGLTLLKQFNSFKNSFKVADLKLPFCYSGLFGYTSFDITKYTENENLSSNPKEAQIPELFYQFFSIILVFNHHNNSLHIISNSKTELESKKQVENIEEEIESNISSFPFQIVSEEESNLSDNEYKGLVAKAKHHCKIGDVFQLVLSRRFKNKFRGDDFNVYRALKNINPSPYLFYFDMGDFRLFGSSPEAQLLVKNKEAEIHPIAGTYKRTGNDELDLQNTIDLKKDVKENSEHVMLVDLARNDLSKYCSNVKVKSFKQIQLYSHVIHLVSNVGGKLKTDVNSFEALLGSFPAGTLSGAPKYKALELINRYEPNAREFYGGCVGFIGLNNDINHAIMIRTFLSKDNTLYYQAGAGIVISSNEENELQEINNKVSALRKAIVNAQKFNNIAEAKVSVLEEELAS
ncbi:MAG: chorismate-binding protein [Bacteroidia bacterium]|nr:chorismate-binding protein [Bacteroidia bacterium]